MANGTTPSHWTLENLTAWCSTMPPTSADGHTRWHLMDSAARFHSPLTDISAAINGGPNTTIGLALKPGHYHTDRRHHNNNNYRTTSWRFHNVPLKLLRLQACERGVHRTLHNAKGYSPIHGFVWNVAAEMPSDDESEAEASYHPPQTSMDTYQTRPNDTCGSAAIARQPLNTTWNHSCPLGSSLQHQLYYNRS